VAVCELCGKNFEPQPGGSANRCPECAARNFEITSARPEQTTQPPQEFATELRQLAPAAPVVTYTLIAINIAVFVIEIAKGAGFDTMSPDLAVRLGANYGPMTLAGQWWRLLSAMFLHFGFLHVFMNMFILLSLGSLAERLMGRAAFSVLYFATGLAGGLASLAVHPQLVSAGASGAVFGVAGGLISYLLFKKAPVDFAKAKKQLTSLGIFLLYNFVYSLRPGIDMMAHLGGVVSGLVIAAALPRFLKAPGAETIPTPLHEQTSTNKRVFAVGIVCALAIVGGAFAITRADADRTFVQSALSQIDAGKSADVIPKLEDISKRKPDMALAHFALGAAYLRTKKYPEAVRELSQAQKLAPNDALTLNQLGAAYLNLEDYDNAITIFRLAVQSDPHESHNFLGLAEALSAKGQNGDAVEMARKAVAAGPNEAEPHSILGQLEIKLGQTDDGIKELETAFHLDPTDEDVRTALVSAYLSKGYTDKIAALNAQTRGKPPATPPPGR
jgi:membrane associated rhomboid family serine protease/cytochrome c-type biogenesis protein CcmH/NrfG